MGIYERDNLQLAEAINNALAHRQAAVDRHNDRAEKIGDSIKGLIGMGSRFAESYGSDSDSTSRGAYVLTGDRSGIEAALAAKRQREAQDAMLARQQAFQDEQRMKQQSWQSAEKALDRLSTEKMFDKQLRQRNEEEELSWRKDYTRAKDAFVDVQKKYALGAATDRDLKDAQSELIYQVGRGSRNGYFDRTIGAPSMPELDIKALDERRYNVSKIMQMLNRQVGVTPESIRSAASQFAGNSDYNDVYSIAMDRAAELENEKFDALLEDVLSSKDLKQFDAALKTFEEKKPQASEFNADLPLREVKAKRAIERRRIELTPRKPNPWYTDEKKQ